MWCYGFALFCVSWGETGDFEREGEGEDVMGYAMIDRLSVMCKIQVYRTYLACLQIQYEF